MYENLLKNFKIDDFWNDCLDRPYSTNFYKEDIIINNNISADMINQNTNINSIKLNFQINRKTYLNKKYPKKVFPNKNEVDNIKSKFILKTQTSTHDLKNIKDALLKEELILLIKEKKNKNNNKIFINLYKKEKNGRELWTISKRSKKKK